jgi:hypothetical protein
MRVVASFPSARDGSARFVRTMISAAAASLILLLHPSAMANDASDLVAGYSYATTCAFIDAATQLSLGFLKKDNNKSHSTKANEQLPNLYRYSIDNISILYFDEAPNMAILEADLPLDVLPAEMKSSVADIDHTKKYFQVKDAAKTEGMTSFSCDAVNLIIEYDNKRTKAIKLINDSGAD